MVKDVNIEILIFSQQEVHLCTWRPPTRDLFSSLAITTMTSIIIKIIILGITVVMDSLDFCLDLVGDTN